MAAPCEARFIERSMVPGAGLEPARPYGQGILSPQCLPFHHPGKGGVTVYGEGLVVNNRGDERVFCGPLITAQIEIATED